MVKWRWSNGKERRRFSLPEVYRGQEAEDHRAAPDVR